MLRNDRSHCGESRVDDPDEYSTALSLIGSGRSRPMKNYIEG